MHSPLTMAALVADRQDRFHQAADRSRLLRALRRTPPVAAPATAARPVVPAPRVTSPVARTAAGDVPRSLAA